MSPSRAYFYVPHLLKTQVDLPLAEKVIFNEDKNFINIASFPFFLLVT